MATKLMCVFASKIVVAAFTYNTESNSPGIPIVFARYLRIFRFEFRLKFMNVRDRRQQKVREHKYRLHEPRIKRMEFVWKYKTFGTC